MKDQPEDAGDPDRYTLTGWRLKQLEDARDDHGERLDKLERWRNWILGAASVVMLTVGTFARQVWATLSGHP